MEQDLEDRARVPVEEWEEAEDAAEAILNGLQWPARMERIHEST